MKRYFFLILLFLFGCKVTHNNSAISNIKSNSILMHHITKLDSVQNKNQGDTIFYCCRYSISIIEEKTGIEASGPGTFIGRLYFTSSDLLKWKDWYLTQKKHSK